MSDYTKTTDFAAKDALLTGNPSKTVLGAEIDTEFNNIATAVGTKLDDVLTTRGDILVEGASGETRLAKGSAGYILRSDGTDPTWHPPIYGARITRATDTSVATSGWDEDVFWGTVDYETVECISSYASGTLITVPAGVSYMKIEINAKFTADATGLRGVTLRSTDATGSNASATGVSCIVGNSGAAGTSMLLPTVSSGWMQVTPGIYYKVATYSTSTASTFYLLAGSHFTVEFA